MPKLRCLFLISAFGIFLHKFISAPLFFLTLFLNSLSVTLLSYLPVTLLNYLPITFLKALPFRLRITALYMESCGHGKRRYTSLSDLFYWILIRGVIFPCEKRSL